MTTSASLNAFLQCWGHIGHVQRSRMDLKHRDNLEHSRTGKQNRDRGNAETQRRTKHPMITQIQEKVSGRRVLCKEFSSVTAYGERRCFCGRWVNHLYYLQTRKGKNTNSSDFKQTRSVKMRKKKETVNNIFIHFVSFSLEMKKKSLVMFLFFFLMTVLMWGCEWGWCECSLGRCWGGGIPLPTKRKKNSPNFSLKKVFPRNISSHASTLCIATGVWQ